MSQSKDLTEAEQIKLNSGRLMRAEADMIIPYLDTKRELICGKIVQSFRSGQHGDLLGHAAELATIYEMKSTITSKIKAAEAIERRIFESEEGEN